MSHVVTMGVKFKNLQALKLAAANHGCELVEGQTTYKQYWTGTPAHKIPAHYVPVGYTAEELGKCTHAIRVVGAGPDTYEIGVVPAKDGDGWELMTDWYAGGYGLTDKVGVEGKLLKQAYTANVGMLRLQKQGMRVTTTVRADRKVLVKGVMG